MIVKPLFWFLQWLHLWVGNWGVAIIVLTVIISPVLSLVSCKLSFDGAHEHTAPRMQRLKEQYGDDRQRMNQAMMEYKTEKINPLYVACR